MFVFTTVLCRPSALALILRKAKDSINRFKFSDGGKPMVLGRGKCDHTMATSATGMFPWLRICPTPFTTAPVSMTTLALGMSKVTNMHQMFRGASSFNQDIGN